MFLAALKPKMWNIGNKNSSTVNINVAQYMKTSKTNCCNATRDFCMSYT